MADSLARCAGRAAYRLVQTQLGLSRAVVVQPNGYMFDNACTEDALRQMGAAARGVATVRPDVADAEIERPDADWLPGARCYMLKGGFLSWEDVETVAARVRPWLACRSSSTAASCPRHEALLSRLPVDVVIDHNGKFREPVPTTDARLQRAAEVARTRQFLGQALGTVRNLENRSTAL